MATAVQVESILGGLTDNSGEPLAAGKVYTYYAGSTTPVSLFTSSDKSTLATNPLILDGHGKAQVWADGRYKFVVKDQYDVTQYTWDNLLYGFDDTISLWGGQSSGSANAHTVSVPATVTAYANGQSVSFIAGYSNTGATTLQFNALGPVSIVKGPDAVTLQDGDLKAGCLYTATYEAYSGTGRFRLGEYPTLADTQRSRFQLATSLTGVNTLTALLTPPISSYDTGLVIRFKALSTTTGPVTLNINSLGPKAVQRYGAALVAGEIKADDMVEVVYDGTQFQLVNATPAPLFIDRTNNRIGIGTTTPADVVEIAGTSSYPQYWTTYPGANVAGANLTIRKSRGATVDTNVIVASNDVLGTFDFVGANGTSFTSAATISAQIDGTPGASNKMPGRLVFSTAPDAGGAPVERMRIDNVGRMGIGTNSPSSSLVVSGDVDATPDVNGVHLGATGGFAGIELANSVGAYLDFTTTGTDYKGRILYTHSDNSMYFATNGTERMRISGTGNVGIGTSSPSASSRLTIKTAASTGTDFAFICNNSSDVGLLSVYADGNIYTGGAPGSPYNNTTGIGANLYIAPNGILQRSSSSLKYKEDIQDMSYGLSKALELRPVTFMMKGSEVGSQRFAGLIAEEVDAAGLSEFVQYGSDGTPDSLSYGNLVALAFKAIQELNAKVESLQAKLGAA